MDRQPGGDPLRAALSSVYEEIYQLPDLLAWLSHELDLPDLARCAVPDDLRDVLVGIKKKDRTTLLRSLRSTAFDRVQSVYALLDLVIERILKDASADARHDNILARGFSLGQSGKTVAISAAHGLRPLVSECTNSNVELLRKPAWHMLFSSIGPKILAGILRHCAVFLPRSSHNYQQVTGLPIMLGLRQSRQVDTPSSDRLRDATSSIIFERHRIFYAQPSMNPRSRVVFGQRHIHILNRLLGAKTWDRRRCLLMSIFPGEHALHNVFSGRVDRSESSHKYLDYAFRADIPIKSATPYRAPRSLRHPIGAHMDELYRRHHRCSYHALLNHHCPADVSASQVGAANIVSHAIPHHQIAAYIRAVLTSILPAGLLGPRNTTALYHALDTFVSLRRYESISLHTILQGMSPSDLPWLRGPGGKVSRCEALKHWQLFREMVYWLVDSFVMPLLRNTFYITEAHGTANRVNYFRHDTWRILTMPRLVGLKLGQFAEMATDVAVRHLRHRALGFSRVRLLPKNASFRLIINLRRRSGPVDAHGRSVAGPLLPSINRTLQPLHAALTMEQARSARGYAVGSVDGIIARLRHFKEKVAEPHGTRRLYFAKVDVKDCFDSIDQTRVLELAGQSLIADQYTSSRYCIARPNTDRIGLNGRWRWRSLSTDRDSTFDVFAEQCSRAKRNVLLVDGVTSTSSERATLLNLLHQHVGMNIVRIGKKFYRHSLGIAQGSVLSSLLCNIYYASMEEEYLSFLGDDRHATMAVRLVDDFLVASTDRRTVEKFVTTMHGGIAAYGCVVNPQKTLVNFKMSCGGSPVRKLEDTTRFPFCGLLIHCKDLHVEKDFSRLAQVALGDTLTLPASDSSSSTLVARTVL